MPGTFEKSKYEASNGDIFPVKVQPETLTLTIGGAANTAPTAAADQTIRARVSGSRRSYGVHTRLVTIQLTAAKTGYKDDAIITLPWLKKSTFDALVPDSTGTYDGTACILIGTREEKRK